MDNNKPRSAQGGAGIETSRWKTAEFRQRIVKKIVESMIHKPPCAWTSPDYRFGHGDGDGGYRLLGSSSSSRLVEGGGSLRHLGEPSSSVAATNSSPGLNVPALTASGEEPSKANDPESSELDLTLKL